MKHHAILISAAMTMFITSSCKPLLRGGLRAARSYSRHHNRSDSGSSNSTSTKQISDTELKKIAKAANLKLEDYRARCSYYKKAFNSNINGDTYNKTVDDFNSTTEKFYNWFNQQQFYCYRASSEFTPKYLAWLKKYRSYLDDYSEAVRSAANRRLTSLN